MLVKYYILISNLVKWHAFLCKHVWLVIYGHIKTNYTRCVGIFYFLTSSTNKRVRRMSNLFSIIF